MAGLAASVAFTTGTTGSASAASSGALGAKGGNVALLATGVAGLSSGSGALMISFPTLPLITGRSAYLPGQVTLLATAVTGGGTSLRAGRSDVAG